MIHQADQAARDALTELSGLAARMADHIGPDVQRAVSLLADSLRAGGQVLTCGNGGSAADALHLSCELVVRFRRERRSLPAVCLCADPAVLTAAGNDYGFEHIFERQVQGLGRAGDVLVLFSTSGTSPNILRAIEAARQRGDAMDHVLLYGPPGLGKTTLATIIANELDVGFDQTSGPILQKKLDLTGILSNIGAQQVFFIDEIHRLLPDVEEMLYATLEDFRVDILVGSGGVLSHAPRRAQAAMMLIDAFLPEGITQLAVDSIFMMPQLGVLSKVNEKAATDVFIRDCLIHLGTCIAPVVQAKMDEPVADIEIGFSDGRTEAVEMRFGSLQTIPLPWAEEPNATVRAIPRGKADFGAGPGKVVERKVAGGLSGLILDGRGRRPFLLPKDDATRVEKLQEWQKALDCYPTSKS